MLNFNRFSEYGQICINAVKILKFATSGAQRLSAAEEGASSAGGVALKAAKKVVSKSDAWATSSEAHVAGKETMPNLGSLSLIFFCQMLQNVSFLSGTFRKLSDLRQLRRNSRTSK